MSSRPKRSRRWRLLGVTAGYLAAIVLGVGSAWWVVKFAPWLNSTVQTGAWRTNLRAGSQDADLYTRASVALNALLALDRSETMYFIATQDDGGRPLRSRCDYRITGTPPQARWWSITAYADDMFLFDVPNGRHSLHGALATPDAAGSFSMTVGPHEVPQTHWVPTTGDRGLVLTLRLYNPAPGLQANPAGLQPPRIVALGDCA